MLQCRHAAWNTQERATATRSSATFALAARPLGTRSLLNKALREFIPPVANRLSENWQVQGHSDPNRELLDARALCRQLVRDGSVEAFLADHRHDLLPDEMFEDLFPSAGTPLVPADVVASVIVLQALEGLSDRTPPVR